MIILASDLPVELRTPLTDIESRHVLMNGAGPVNLVLLPECYCFKAQRSHRGDDLLICT
jgi:hypothetical protein